jgi:hypothetical protein
VHDAGQSNEAARRIFHTRPHEISNIGATTTESAFFLCGRRVCRWRKHLGAIGRSCESKRKRATMGSQLNSPSQEQAISEQAHLIRLIRPMGGCSPYKGGPWRTTASAFWSEEVKRGCPPARTTSTSRSTLAEHFSGPHGSLSAREGKLVELVVRRPAARQVSKEEGKRGGNK